MSSMHQGLDLSRFKKVSSDKKTTTLRHAKGHEIKIAHSGLTPKMKEHLDSLPAHDGKDDKRKMYADTEAEVGSPEDDAPEEDAVSEEPLDNTSPAAVSDEPNAVPAPVADMPSAPAADPIQQQETPQLQHSSTLVPTAPVQKPTVQPIDPMELKTHDALFAQDLTNGHIKPETYEDLFDKKSTLGKIGTLFGLMLSGAGSGLSGQPNAVMEMMNKQISNDLDAQKQSKINAHNFIQLNQQQQMNMANISRLQKEGVLTEAQAKLATQDTKTKAYTLARMQMNQAALHKLVVQANKYPVGSPQRQAADQQLALMGQAVQSENYDLADKAAAASALGHLAFGQNDSGDEGKFQQSQGALRMSGNAPLAEDRASRHMPGVEGMASVPLTGGDREQINSGITFQDQLKRFSDWTKSHSGDLSPKDRNEGEAMAAQLQGAYRQVTHGGVYKEGEQGFISNIIDSTPTKFFNKVRVLPQLTAVQKESSAQLNQLLKSKGFQGYVQDGTVAKNPSTGEKVVRKEGKWVPLEMGASGTWGTSKRASK